LFKTFVSIDIWKLYADIRDMWNVFSNNLFVHTLFSINHFLRHIFFFYRGDRWSRSDAEDVRRCRMSVGFPSRNNDDAAILGSCSPSLAITVDNFCNEACSDNAREDLSLRAYNMRRDLWRNCVLRGGRCFMENDTSVCAEWTPHIITRQIFGGDKRKIEVFAPEKYAWIFQAFYTRERERERERERDGVRGSAI